MMQTKTLQDMSAAIAGWRSPSLMRVKPARAMIGSDETDLREYRGLIHHRRRLNPEKRESPAAAGQRSAG
jgi:hypothetical protein